MRKKYKALYHTQFQVLFSPALTEILWGNGFNNIHCKKSQKLREGRLPKSREAQETGCPDKELTAMINRVRPALAIARQISWLRMLALSTTYDSTRRGYEKCTEPGAYLKGVPELDWLWNKGSTSKHNWRQSDSHAEGTAHAGKPPADQAACTAGEVQTGCSLLSRNDPGTHQSSARYDSFPRKRGSPTELTGCLYALK